VEIPDADDDGIPDAHDVCYGDNSFGDADLNGICDDRDYCGTVYCCANYTGHSWCAWTCNSTISNDISPGTCVAGCCYSCYDDCVEIDTWIPVV
jgi:hypothetical protein